MAFPSNNNLPINPVLSFNPITSSIPINANVPMAQNNPITGPFFSSNGLLMNPASQFMTQTQVQNSPQPFPNYVNIPNNGLP
jgi:hypothetical protein